jgi:hypothetical protein
VLSWAQDTTLTRQRQLVLSAGIGPSWFASPPGVPEHLHTDVNRWGGSVSGRLMWHPEHLLRLGVESGWTRLYSYDLHAGEDGSLHLSGIPLLVQFSMPLGPHVEVFVGYGTYRLTSRLNYLGEVNSSFFSQGYAAALAYHIPLNTRSRMAMELKYMNAFVTGHHILALQWRMDLALHQW